MFSCLSKLWLFGALLASTNSVSAWGRDGHALIANIAQSLLTTEATEFVRTYLPSDNGTMSNVSSWADNILYADTEPNYLNWQWSSPLHYVNTRDWSCVYDRLNDCNWNSTQGCVDGAIQNYTTRLANPELGPTQLEEALKFIIHFIGDVHQPLHGGFASDLGGNTIRGDFFGRSVNFHSLWDTTMIQHRMNQDFQSQSSLYLEHLMSQMNGRYVQHIAEWTNCTSTDDSQYMACSSMWIQEDAELCCEIVYRDELYQQITSQTGFNISETYYNTRIDTIELRLIQSGVRLAATINEIVRKNYTGSGTLPQLSLLLIAFSTILLNSMDELNEFKKFRLRFGTENVSFL